jgi:hypothetical protein
MALAGLRYVSQDIVYFASRWSLFVPTFLIALFDFKIYTFKTFTARHSVVAKASTIGVGHTSL